MMQVYSPLSTAIDNETTKTWVYRLRKLTTHKGDVYYQSINSGATAGVFTYGSWIKVAKISDIPTSLKNPNAMTIDNQSYDGSSAVNFTSTIDNIIDTKMRSVKVYGAVGNGTTDDTLAFATAMKENRVVFVPGGTYKLSSTLVIPENCCLELSQDTVLKFTQTSDNCIEMRGSATLRGNHAVICVPYEFTGNVIDINTLNDGTDHATSIPPYTKSSPQFKRQRFIYDINIIKPIDNYGNIGFCSSSTGDCNGTAIYISATNVSNQSDDIPWMWALTLSGIRIAGAFSYGIHAINYDSDVGSSGHYTDDAWNHDMRIEAVIEACEIGVALENCNAAHLQVTIQPSQAVNGAVYAKHGVYLNDSRAIDMIGSRIWDWNTRASLWTEGGQYQHIAMIGNCRGLLLDDFNYYEFAGHDIRDLIYTDTPSNLEQMTILQEPFTRWFRPVDGKPMYYDGLSNREIQLKDDKITLDQAEFIIGAEGENVTIPNFTNLAAEYGYTDNAYILGGKQNNGATSTLGGFVTTGFIPIEPAVGHIYRIGGRSVVAYEDATYGTYFRICWYDADKNAVNDPSPMGQFGSSEWYPAWVEDDTVAIAFATTPVYNQPATAAYIRISLEGSGADLIVTVDEEQTYTTKWEGTPGMLDESVYAQKTLIKSPDGKLFELKVSNDGVISTSIYSG